MRQVVLRVNNERWKDVPFIIRAGKACHKRKCEVIVAACANFETDNVQVRIQFRGASPPNKLVFRVQPDEAIYLQIHTKAPALSHSNIGDKLPFSFINQSHLTSVSIRYSEPTEMTFSLHSRKRALNMLSFPDGYEEFISNRFASRLYVLTV